MRAHPLLAPLPLLLALLACDASNPVAPTEGTPPAPATAYTVVLSADPASATAGVTEMVTITVTVASNDGGGVAGKSMSISTTLGTLEAGMETGALLTLTLDSDEMSVMLMPGDEPGTAEVLARIDDSAGSVMIDVADPGDPPVAAFEATPIGTAVQFVDMSIGDPTAWFWEFGGPAAPGQVECPAASTPPEELTSPCTDQNPAFTYAEPGTYLVALTVERFSELVTTDPSNFRSTVRRLVAVEVPPEAAFATERRKRSVIFTDLSSGNPTEWEWSFGEFGATSTLQNPSHTYRMDGDFAVTLTVRTSAGTSTASRFVCVNNREADDFCPATTTTTGE